MSDEAGKKGNKGKKEPKAEGAKKEKAPKEPKVAAEAKKDGDAAPAAAAKKEKKEKAAKGEAAAPAPAAAKKGKAAAKEEVKDVADVDEAAEAKAEADTDAAETKALADGDAEPAETNADDTKEDAKTAEKKEKAPPARPDYHSYQFQIKKHEGEVKTAEAAFVKHNNEITAKQDERTRLRNEKKAQADRLAEAKKKTVILYNEAAALQAQIAKEEAATLHIREQLLEAKAGLADLAQLDARIAELAPTLRTKSGAELQRARTEEAALKASRDRLRLQRDRMTATREGGTDTTALRNERQAKTEAAKKMRDEQDKASTAFNQARNKETRINKEIEGMIKIRQQLSNDRNLVKQELVKCKRTYENQDAAYKKYIALQAKAVKDKDTKPKVARVAETNTFKKDGDDEDDEAKKEPAVPAHPFAAELGMTDLLVRYLVGLLPKGAAADAEDKSEADAKAAAVVAARNSQFKGTAKGVRVAVSKKGQQEPLWGDLKKAAPAKKEKVVVEAAVVKKLIHIPDVFSMFEQLGVAPPLTKDNVAASLEELKSLRTSTFEGEKTAADKTTWEESRLARRKTENDALKKLVDAREAEKDAKTKAKRRADRDAAKGVTPAASNGKEEKTASKATKATAAAAEPVVEKKKAEKVVEEKSSPKKGGRGSKKQAAPEPEPVVEVAAAVVEEETPAVEEAAATEEVATEEAAAEEVAATEEAAATEETPAAEETAAVAVEEVKAEEPAAVVEEKAAEPVVEASVEVEAASSPVAASEASAAAAGGSPKSKKKKGSKAAK